ncbi:hypothetical protein ASPZODRAFT_159015 [Penicilliopsis zonata CBS 506.65]|uniref:Large ribosomal subunit protein mL46 n=1 Tax=Penicilliopsis zonata CBS 506.65 TaxID=1073090 RepID=A0A1L9SIP1_9EURO|nr:hypothetical protein ASPZODRAFT_159015 [Penicilliopsis zonata CBS 506.65]OJJ47017.1 hypothetical protein ASPZODRAFT_159015 [Penicilliopsis zonata CBS 506.65]
MEVTSHSFSYYLPRILDDLATGCFVSLDLEFSGIAKPAFRSPSSGPQTLQERYEEVKGAAEKYQVLQIGLTICHEDTATASYTLKPFNFYLNPVINQRLEVDRDFTFQSGAIQFLVQNRFRLDALVSEGISYLSRREEALAFTRAEDRRDRVGRNANTAINVKQTDYESLQFLSMVRRHIDDWLAVKLKTDDSYLNIPPPTRLGQTQASTSWPLTLNKFQQRLIHQLLEVEYPALVAVNKATFMQIIPRDEAREKAVREDRMQWAERRIRTETGFRWIVEALTGGDLTHLDSSLFMGIMSSAASVKGKYPLNEFADKLKARLKSHRPVLVGHNLFTDLVNFYRCFFGPLPDRVEQFQQQIHELFPVLMDTKYMATHDCGSINPSSTLSEIHTSLAEMKYPKIEVHPDHNKYSTNQKEHEAGYDSFLTAEVFIKLSAQLRKQEMSRALPSTSLDNNSTPQDQTRIKPAKAKKRSRRRKSTRPQPGSLNAFEALSVQEEDNDVSTEVTEKISQGHLIPRPADAFWQVYGNKLRMFGPSRVESPVCRSCQETLGRRSYATDAVSTESSSASASALPVVKPSFLVQAGVVLSRPPQITRDLTPFEKSYYFYQRRLNERLAQPFSKYFYFKRGTPADEDWKRQIRERQTAARDIGNYNAYSPEAWNDELLVGAVESEPQHQIEKLIQNAEATANATSQDVSRKEEIPRPFPRVTEADQKNDQKRLDRALQRTLYLLVKSKEGFWKFPSSPIETGETLRVAAERTLAQSAGVNMNTWMVGYHPVGHHVYNFRRPKTVDATGAELVGEKTFFMKGRIMAGQADLAANEQELEDFKWLSKDEIQTHVLPQYYSNIKNMLAEL